MENFKLVLPEHLNHLGKLFGGQLLRWVDESAYIAARMELPGCNFVTIAMSQVEFRHQVEVGAILRLEVKREKLGNTSVAYAVDVTEVDDAKRRTVFSTIVTFVNVGEDGGKRKIG
jgi:acyl-CoA hydrolase